MESIDAEDEEGDFEKTASRNDSSEDKEFCHSHDMSCHVDIGIAAQTTASELVELRVNAQEQIHRLIGYRAPRKTKYITEMMKLLEDLAPDSGLFPDKRSQNDADNTETVDKLWNIFPHAKVQINNLIKNRHCKETNNIRRMMRVLNGISPVTEGGEKRQTSGNKCQERGSYSDMNKRTRSESPKNIVQSEEHKSKNKKFDLSRKSTANCKTYKIKNEARFCHLTFPKPDVTRYKNKTTSKEQLLQICQVCHKKETLEGALKEKIVNLEKTVFLLEEQKSEANKNVELLKERLQQRVQEKNCILDQMNQMRITKELEKEKRKKEKEILEGKVSELKYSLSDRDKKIKVLQVELQRQNDNHDTRVSGGKENYFKTTRLQQETYERTLESLQEENKDLINQLFHEREKFKALGENCFNKITGLEEINRRLEAEMNSAEPNEPLLKTSLHLQILAKDEKIENLRSKVSGLCSELEYEKNRLRRTEELYQKLMLQTKQESLGKDQDDERFQSFQKDIQLLQSTNIKLQDIINQLRKEKNILSARNQETETELQRSRNDLQRSTKDTKAFTSEIDFLRKKMDKLQNALTSEREQVKTKDVAFKCITGSLKQEVENKDKEIAHLRHLLKVNEESETRQRQINENFETLEKNRKDLQQKFECLQEENDLLREENKKMSKVLFDKEENMKRNETGLKVERSQTETLKNEVTRLTKQLQLVNNEVIVQKEGLKAKEKEFHLIRMSSKHEINNLRQENEQLREVIEKKTERSEAEQHQHKVQSSDQQRQHEIKVNELKGVNSKLNTENEALRVKCEQLDHEKSRLNDKLIAENQHIEKLKEQLSWQEVQVSDLNVALSLEKERLQTKEEEFEGVILSTKQLSLQNQTLREHLEEEFTSKARTLQTHYEHKQIKSEEQVDELRRNEKTLKTSCQQLEQDKSKLTEEIINKEHHLKKQEKDLRDLRLELAQLAKTNERLQKEVTESKQMQNSLEDELKQKQSSSEQEIEKMKSRLTEQSQSLLTECQHLKQSNLKLQEQITKEKENFKIQVYKYQQDLDTKNKEMKQVLARKREVMQTQNSLTDRLHILENRIGQLTDDKNELTKQLTEKKNIITSQNDTLDHMREDNAKLNEELKNKKNTRDKVDKEHADKIVELEKILASLKQEMNSVMSTNVQLRNQEVQYKQQMEMYQAQNKTLVEKVKKEENSMKRENDMNVLLQDENQKLQNKVQQLSRGDLSNSVLQQQCYDLREQLKLAHKELDETKSRLSRAMGDRLTDNNPNITDLSDKNRPTKISERYQELYDNQWTDAFEVIDKDFGKEELTIKALKDILTETVKFCKLEAINQIQQMTKALSKGKDVPAHIMKQLKDTRKALAERYGKELYQEYLDQLRRSKANLAKMALEVPQYHQECFEICWLMAVQDPPVVFGLDIPRGGAFNKDHYKAYTKGGDTVKFVVWPVLLLHEGGPVLCKGVAQG